MVLLVLLVAADRRADDACRDAVDLAGKPLCTGCRRSNP
jgi:hypothetical protein